MPNAIGSSGLTTATQTELSTQYIADFQGIYGAAIDLSSNTPDGQIINDFIQSVLDVEDLLVQINAMFDPDQAIGAILDQRVAINGIQRQAGTFTVTPVSITISTSGSVNLYGLDQAVQPVYTVSDASGNEWELQETRLGVTSGTYSYLFQAAVPGQVLTTIGTITVPVTIVLGVTTINNPSTYSTLGINEETDANLKVRRQQSVAISSQGYFASLFALLQNIPGIGAVKLYENDSDSTSTGSAPPNVPSGIPSHSIWVVVAEDPPYPTSSVTAYNSLATYQAGDLALSGGVVYASGQNNNTGNSVSNYAWWWPFDQVASAIYLKRNAGCGMKGSQSAAVTQLDGSQFIVKWDLVSPEALFIAVYLTALAPGTTPNYAAISAGLVTSFVPGINQEVNVTALGTAIQAIDPNSLVTFSGASTPSTGGFSTSSGGAYTNTLSPSAANNQFEVTSSNIILLPVILTPASTTVARNGTQTFTPFGGYGTAGTPFTCTNSYGTINGTTGVYTAGGSSSGSNSDTITFTDALGNTATATIKVT